MFNDALNTFYLRLYGVYIYTCIHTYIYCMHACMNACIQSFENVYDQT